MCRFDHSLLIERPLELRGSSVPVFGPDGLPTGVVVPGTETRLVGTDSLGPDSLGSDPLISAGRTDGVVISGVTISGFILSATTASNEVLLTRVQNYSIRNNVFLAPGNFGMHSIASSGVVARKLLLRHFHRRDLLWRLRGAAVERRLSGETVP